MKNITKKPGIVTLISVIIIGAVSIVIAVSLLANGINSSKNSLTNIRSSQANSLADACAEEAMQKIRDTSFTGSFNLSFSTGTCSSTVISTSSPNFTIDSLGSSTSALEKIQIVINQISPKINILSWQELKDF